jgi:hypothetical protein
MKPRHSETLVPHVSQPPLEQVRVHPWSFVVLALSAGVFAGLLLRFRGVRRLLGAYVAVRRIL